MTLKVHKEHEEGKAPPERPICSGNGSAFENVSSATVDVKGLFTHIPSEDGIKVTLT